MGLRLAATLVALCSSAPLAAQPTDPGTPQPPDFVLAEQIAEQLVARAQELLDARIWLDAKQLAVEALVKSPKGNAADRARYIIRVVNQQLDIKEDPPPTPPSVVKPHDDVDLSPIDGSQAPPLDPRRDPPPSEPGPQERDGELAARVHGALYVGVLGATIGAFAGGDRPVAVAVPVGIVTGLGAGLLAPRLTRWLGWDEAQIRTAGSLSAWGGVMGSMFGTAVTGADESATMPSKPTARGVLLGASVGSTLGLAGGAYFAHERRLTRGDVALVDTLAGIGAVGGLTIGMLMQPAQPEAYAVNALLGTAGGVVIGLIAAPQTQTTPGRMLRVAGVAAAGGAIPFLLYAVIADSSTSADERVVGFLSSAGLVGGAYLGFRLTSDFEVGQDVHDRKATDDAPAALFGRHSDGTWSFGGLGVQQLSSRLATHQRGLTFTLVGATF
jgi:hypothetical protein